MILLIGLQSCKTSSVEDYEIKVLDEIFDELIEKMNATNYWIPPPPPSEPPVIYDILDLLDTEQDNIKYQTHIKWDSIEYQKLIVEYEKIINELKNDTTTIVIAVSDTFYTCYKDEYIKRNKSQITEQGYVEALNAMADSSVTSRLFDLSKITKRESIALKYLSEFPEGKKIWERENYDFFFSGVLDISRIYFDNSRQFGLFYCSFMCGRLCGEGIIICIRKIDDKWRIEEMISLWVS